MPQITKVSKKPLSTGLSSRLAARVIASPPDQMDLPTVCGHCHKLFANPSLAAVHVKTHAKRQS